MTSSKGSGDRRHNRGEVCPDCGFVHERCLGHAKHTNEDRAAAARKKWGTDGPWPCMKRPDRGLEVCVRHGGAAPQAKAAAAERVAKARAIGEVGRLLGEAGAGLRGRPLVVALQDSLDRAGEMVAVLGLLVAELDEGTDWYWGETRGPQGSIQRHVILDGTVGLIGPSSKGEQKANVLVELYGTWVDRLGRLAKAAGDLGLEERRVALDEAKAQAVVGAVLAGLRDAGADTPEVRTAIAGRLRALEGGEAA